MQTGAKDLGFSVGRLTRITDWMQRYLDAGKLPGAITLVARRGEVAYLEALGQRDVAAGLPLTEDTIFRIYSMTKPVAAVAVMMLYEEGLFRLSDPVSAYLPRQPFRTVFLDWDVGVSPDELGEAEALERYTELYREITVRIRDLMETLRGEEAD